MGNIAFHFLLEKWNTPLESRKQKMAVHGRRGNL